MAPPSLCDIDISAAITRTLHLAIIAQIQAWEAASHLELLLESEYVPGTPEHAACRLHVDGAIQAMASYPNVPLPELLTAATHERIKETLIQEAAERSRLTDANLVNWIIETEPDIEKTIDDRWRVVGAEEYIGDDLREVIARAIQAEVG